VDPGWTGGAAGFLVMRIVDGSPRYVGMLRPRRDSIGPWKPSELAAIDPGERPGSLFLVDGSVRGVPCAGGTTCERVIVGDDDGVGDTIQIPPTPGWEALRTPGGAWFIVRPWSVGPWEVIGWMAHSGRVSTQPVPTCDQVDGGLCAALADRAVGDTPEVVSIDVGRLHDRCVRPAGCPLPAHGGPVFTHEVTATLNDGSGRSWVCAATSSDLSCVAHPATEPSALGTVRVVVDGAASRYVVFVNDHGTDFDLTVEGTKTLQLTRGRWEMYSAEVAPPGPLNDVCPSSLHIEPGAQLELRISVTNAICSHDVGPDASTRS
jgi:hypothetical protein